MLDPVLRPDDVLEGRQFSADRVFVASSGDIDTYRSAIVVHLRQLLHRSNSEKPLWADDWKTCEANEPFDHRRSFQTNIPRPSDPNIKGVVCLFSERIGIPLEDEFDLNRINGIEKWISPNRKYRLLHPWPMDISDQQRYLGEGFFPLTGTVFEVLDALGAENTPIFVAYLASNDLLLKGNQSPDELALGGRRLKIDAVQKKTDSDFKLWMSKLYEPQIQGVFNFLSALLEHHLAIERHTDLNTIVSAVDRWVNKFVVKAGHNSENPYRFLDFYDITDSKDLPGRAQITRDTVVELSARLARASRSPNNAPAVLCRISGESGCGKTSFLRAGVLAGLLQESVHDNLSTVIFRPTDFHNERGLPQRVLHRMLELVELQNLTITISATDRAKLQSANSKDVARLACDVAIAALNSARVKHLVFGLDQFEEVIDEIVDPQAQQFASEWLPLIEFVDFAAQTGRFGFVFTLESSREDAFDRANLPAAFYDAYHVRLGGHSEAFLQTIIMRPFELAQLHLSQDIVKAILNDYRQYLVRANAPSMLPLLALKLSNLFEYVYETLGGGLLHMRSTNQGTLTSSFKGQRAEVTIDDVKDELGIEHEIEDLANFAWGHGSPSDLNRFLMPFVALSGEEKDRIVLQSIVANDLRSTFSDQLKRFQSVRLIVKESGRLRLVHEAVVRNWSKAREWLADHRQFLEREADFRIAAMNWAKRGELEEEIPDDENAISLAATILRGKLDVWSDVDQNMIVPRDKTFREYCLKIFQKNRTPFRDSDGDYLNKSYVSLAIHYDLLVLLKAYHDADPNVFNKPTGSGRLGVHHAAFKKVETLKFVVARTAPENICAKDAMGWPAIAGTIYRNDLANLRVLAEHFRTAQSMDGPNSTNMLHLCASFGRVDMAKYLLIQVDDLDISSRDALDRSILEHACSRDNVSFFQDFYRRISNAGRTTSAGNLTILHYAALSNAEKIAKWLLQTPGTDVDLTAVDMSGRDALMLAAEYRSDRVAELLAGALDPNRVNETPLRTAKGLDIPNGVPTAAALAGKLLVDAAQFFKTLANQNPELADQMTENADVFIQMAGLLVQDPTGDLNGTTYGELSGKLLSDAGTFFDSLAEKNEPIRDQMKQNADVYRSVGEMVKQNPLATLGADEEAAVSDRRLSIREVDEPEKEGPPKNIPYYAAQRQECRGWSALHYAIAGNQGATRLSRHARHGIVRTANAILRNPQTNPNLASPDGETPFTRASRHPKLRSLLLAHPRFDPDKKLPGGRTPLNVLIESNDRAAIHQMLLQPSLQIDQLNDDGTYSFDFLIRRGMYDLALDLLQKGRTNPWNVVGASSLGLESAVIHNQTDLVDALFAALPHIWTAPVKSELSKTIWALLTLGARSDLIDDLLDKDPALFNSPLDNWGLTPFHCAAFNNHQNLFVRLSADNMPKPPADALGRLPYQLLPSTASAHSEQAQLNGSGTKLCFLTDVIGWQTAEASFIDRFWANLPNEKKKHRLFRDGVEVLHFEFFALSFYKRARLLRVSRTDQDVRLLLYFVVLGDTCYALDGKSGPIHVVNGEDPPTINALTAVEYLIYFCSFVTASDGPFYVIASLDDPMIPRSIVDYPTGNESPRTLRQLFQSPRQWGTDAECNIAISCLVYYGNTIFFTDFKVEPSGSVQMLHGSPLLTDLPRPVDHQLDTGFSGVLMVSEIARNPAQNGNEPVADPATTVSVEPMTASSVFSTDAVGVAARKRGFFVPIAFAVCVVVAIAAGAAAYVYYMM